MWVDKWHWTANINLPVDRKRKKLYSRLVLVTSLFPTEMIFFFFFKVWKTKQKNQKRRHIGKEYQEWHGSRSPGPSTHTPFLSPSIMRGPFCYQMTMEQVRGTRCTTNWTLQNTKMGAGVARRRGNLYIIPTIYSITGMQPIPNWLSETIGPLWFNS